jgi:hypothetical protein
MLKAMIADISKTFEDSDRATAIAWVETKLREIPGCVRVTIESQDYRTANDEPVNFLQGWDSKWAEVGRGFVEKVGAAKVKFVLEIDPDAIALGGIPYADRQLTALWLVATETDRDEDADRISAVRVALQESERRKNRAMGYRVK